MRELMMRCFRGVEHRTLTQLSADVLPLTKPYTAFQLCFLSSHPKVNVSSFYPTVNHWLISGQEVLSGKSVKAE